MNGMNKPPLGFPLCLYDKSGTLEAISNFYLLAKRIYDGCLGCTLFY